MSLLVSKSARRHLAIEDSHTDSRGRVTVGDFTSARAFAQRLSRLVDPENKEKKDVSAGELAALDVLGDFFRALFAMYERRQEEEFLQRLSRHLGVVLGEREMLGEMERFSDAFGLGEVAEFALRESTDSGAGGHLGEGGEERILELVLLWLQWRNPAARRLVRGLHHGFETTRTLRRIFVEIERFFGACAGMRGESLAADLLDPFRLRPNSLSDQLALIREMWGDALGGPWGRLQAALDLWSEENAPRWAPGGAPPVEAPALSAEAEENYSPDSDWMPSLVLAAKNTLVWLHQLSNAYGRDIRRLDQIPEEEMALLAHRGITGLWLIGLWERSEASSEIKRRRGNPEAAASAYSLRSYRIADEFGGEEALDILRRRALRYGIRLAADMVPNHMGIDSDWVLESPERFVQVSRSPFPAYSFSGSDLSTDPDVGIFLEDHYYDGSDAAVVFKRLDRRTGGESFLYHGNDGTSMPWNDTAQLDYLNPEVREAVIETILEVARRFSVIRFDAAMTLAKKHYQRLWHPQPGDAGAIPSRAEHGLSREEFDRRMPREFWREVVERVASEAPDTLLLAEAFWLMEGYFVRTLGLHRVYNSAFMHMMRDRETGKFRRLIEETLAFDPEILKRYVNFVSNPDEESAASQFDVGDRYFGVCTVLATLPGLPMLAHGQWDGLREKYGMEYRRSYREELPTRRVIERHDREIAPLLRRRASFSGVEDFRLYHLLGTAGHVHGDVLAYTNGRGDNATLVLFNNSPNSVAGVLSVSAPRRLREKDNRSEQTWIGDALPVAAEKGWVTVLRDSIRNLHLLTALCRDGEMPLELRVGPYGAVVLDEFESFEDPESEWSALADHLEGAMVRNLQLEMVVFRARSLLEAVDRLVAIAPPEAGLGDSVAAGDVSTLASRSDIGACAAECDRELATLLAGSPFTIRQEPRASEDGHDPGPVEAALSALTEAETRRPFTVDTALRSAVILMPVVQAVRERGDTSLAEAFARRVALESKVDIEDRNELAAILVLANRERWIEEVDSPGLADLAGMARRWRADEDARVVLRFHEAAGREWIVREGLDLLLAARVAGATQGSKRAGGSSGEEPEMAALAWRLARKALATEARRGEYDANAWVERLDRRRTEVTAERVS